MFRMNKQNNIKKINFVFATCIIKKEEHCKWSAQSECNREFMIKLTYHIVRIFTSTCENIINSLYNITLTVYY